MDDRELEMNRRELEAYLRGEGTMTRSLVGQPYNGIASNIYQQNLGVNARRRLYDSQFAMQMTPSFSRTMAQANEPAMDGVNPENSLLESQANISRMKLQRIQDERKTGMLPQMNTFKENSISQLSNEEFFLPAGQIPAANKSLQPDD